VNFLKDITLGQYYPANSILHRLDPRSKLFATILLLTGLMLTTDLVVNLAILSAIAVGAPMGRLPRRLFLGNLRPFRWLFALTYLIHIVYTEGSVVCTVPLLHLRISLGGVIQGTVYSLRLGSFVLLSALMTSTT